MFAEKRVKALAMLAESGRYLGSEIHDKQRFNYGESLRIPNTDDIEG